MQPTDTMTTPENSWRSTDPKVSIIILNWNSYEVTRDCLLSLRKLNYSNREIVLVDNGSVDRSGERLAREFPEVRLIRNQENLGFTGGNNAGMRFALSLGSEYFLLLNNDTLAAPDFLTKLIEIAEPDPTIGMLSPKIYFDQPRDRIWFAGGAYNRGSSFPQCFGMGRQDHKRYDCSRDISFVSGCAFLIKIAVVAQIGLLDDTFFLGFEDLDWSIRVSNAGYRGRYVPDAVIWHKEGYDTKRNLGKAVKDFYYARNSILLARKYCCRQDWFRFVPSFGKYLLYRSAAYLIRGEGSRVKALVRGVRSGCQPTPFKVSHRPEGTAPRIDIS